MLTVDAGHGVVTGHGGRSYGAGTWLGPGHRRLDVHRLGVRSPRGRHARHGVVRLHRRRRRRLVDGSCAAGASDTVIVGAVGGSGGSGR